MGKFILGISAYYHDSADTLLKNGEIIAVDPTVNDYLFIDYITYVK